MLYHFKRPEVERLLEHTLSALSHVALTGYPETDEPGLWLAGDHGIYLVSNGLPALPGVNPGAYGMGTFAAYAVECNPMEMSFGDWRASLRVAYGDEDSVDFVVAEDFQIAIQQFPNEALLEISITPSTLAVTVAK